MANQRNDATASAQGITFQFLVALECCFKMKPNEKVYIEKFGDVTVESISNNIQIEVKRRSDTLTKGSIEIWNTFYNWLQDGADWQQYSSLVFMTTQSCSPSSIWHKWNTISVAERIAEFRKLLNQKSGQLREIKEHVANCLNNETLLKQFVERIYIASVDKSSDFWIKQLSPYSKSIPEQNKLVFYNSLLGFILQNGVFEKSGWEITNEEFSAEVKSISEFLIETSIKFPKVQYNLGELENYKGRTPRGCVD